MSSRALPWPRSSADASVWALSAAAAGVALGIAAEASLYGLGPRYWVPDLLTGWCLIACGVVGWWRRGSWSAALLAAAGFSWFAGNFSAHALFVYRGPLIAAVLTYPAGRVAGRSEGVGVAAVSVAAATASVGRSDYATIALAVSLVAVASVGYRNSVGSERRRRFYALQAAFFLAAVLTATAVLHLALPAADYSILLAYEVSLCGLALALVAGLQRAPWEHREVTDLVVEVSTTRSGSIRAALGRALGDPTLEIAYPLPDGGYVDLLGHPVELPGPGSARRVTCLTREGAEIAMLVHDRAVFDDPELVEAVASAARLASANARLQLEVASQVEEVDASRRRLIDAAGEERRRLELRLNEGAVLRLRSVQRVLREAQLHAGTDTSRRIRRAEDQAAQAMADLDELAAGLHPRELTEGGLAAALAELAGRAPVTVQLDVSTPRLPPEIEAAAYYVCSEALANVVKYASATHATISATTHEQILSVGVSDDGVGGADPRRGSGLRGLADRVEALGGALTIESPAGRGTRVAAVFSLSES